MPIPSEITYPSFAMCVPFGDQNALRQFLDLYNFVSSLSLVYLLPSVPELPFQTYTSNLGIVLAHLPETPIVVSNFTAEERRPETLIGTDYFNLMGYPTTVAPPFFEGSTDLKYFKDNIYFGADKGLTSPGLHQWFSELFAMEIIPLKLVDPKIYPLDFVIFRMSREKVLLNIAALDERSVKLVERVAEVIPVDPALRYAGLTSLLRVRRMVIAGSNITMLRATDPDYDVQRQKVDTLTRICADAPFEPVFFNISEFTSEGVDLSAFFLRLNHSDFLKNIAGDT